MKELQVAFKSCGEEIFGILHLPEKLPAPAVIMCHGFTGGKSESARLLVRAARDFARHGLLSLRFDFRGLGDSAGEFQDMTLSGEIADAAAALKFVRARPEVRADAVGVLGISLGGCVAACLAGRDNSLCALVLWSAVAQTEWMYQGLEKQFGEEAVLDYGGWGLGRGFWEDLLNIHPLEEIKHYSGPSLIVHGTADEVVPRSDAEAYREVLGKNARFHLIAGASHTFARLAWKAEVIELTRKFLVETLRSD